MEQFFNKVAQLRSPLTLLFLIGIWQISVSLYLLSDKKTITLDYFSGYIKEKGWFVWFYGISTFVGYLTSNPFLCK